MVQRAQAMLPEKRVFYTLIFLFLFKKSIQPQVPLRLPCYDFAPVTNQLLELYIKRNKISAY